MGAPHGIDALSEEERSEYWAALALRCTEGLSRHSVRLLLGFFGSAYESVRSCRRWPEAGVSGLLAERYLRNAWREKAAPEWMAAHGLDADIILWTDARYPSRLRHIADAPPLLYVKGDASILDSPCVAVIGSRRCSRGGADAAAAMGRGLSSAGITVASGAAAGIDQAAQLAASPLQGRSIIVLASGISAPMQNAELCRRIAARGALVSEFPPHFPASRATFPIRNRIISGISLGVLVVEASSEKSGSLITARMAAEQGRSVYVPAPGSIRGGYPEGTKALLLEGASPVCSASDILADLLPHLKEDMLTLSRKKAAVSGPAPAEPCICKTPCSPAGYRDEPPREQKENSPEAPPREKPSPDHILCTRNALHNKCTNDNPEKLRQHAGDESFILALLEELPMAPDDLLHAAMEQDPSWTARRLSSLLMVMEVKRLVRRRADARYEAL